MDISFLKKVGEFVNAGSMLIPMFGPLISVLIPKAAAGVQNVSDELPQIAAAIAQVEAIGQASKLPGAKKLEMAAPIVEMILMGSALFKGKPIGNPELFRRAAIGMASAMADALNSLDEAAVDTTTIPTQQPS